MQTLTHPDLPGALNFPHAPGQGGGRRERLPMYRDEGILLWELLPRMGKMDWELSSRTCCSGSGLVQEEGFEEVRKRMGKSRVGVLAAAKGWWHLQSRLGCTNPGFHQDVVVPHRDKKMWLLQQTAPLKELPSSRVCDHPLEILLGNCGGTWICWPGMRWMALLEICIHRATMGKWRGRQESFRQLRIAGFMARGESETEPGVDSLGIPHLMNLPPADPITLLTG